MYNVMSMNSLDKGIEMLDKLDTVLENISFRIELESLTEASNGNKVKSKEKGKLMNLAKTAASNFWDWLERVVNELLDMIRYMTRVSSGKDAILNKDMTVSLYCDQTIPGEISQILNDIKNAEAPDLELLGNRIQIIRNRKKDHKAGERINVKGIYSNLKYLKKEAAKMRKEEKYANKHRDVSASIMSNITGFYKDIISDIRSLITNTDSLRKAKKAQGSNGGQATNESAVPYGMSRNEYIASIMLEAADLLKDDVVKDSSEVKEFSDIPEETPVKQDDYNTATVGGDDEKPDLEEIKDLCDGDPEVVKLLTDDEDKSVTVDSDGETNTESAFDFFNLDF